MDGKKKIDKAAVKAAKVRRDAKRFLSAASQLLFSQEVFMEAFAGTDISLTSRDLKAPITLRDYIMALLTLAPLDTPLCTNSLDVYDVIVNIGLAKNIDGSRGLYGQMGGDIVNPKLLREKLTASSEDCPYCLHYDDCWVRGRSYAGDVVDETSLSEDVRKYVADYGVIYTGMKLIVSNRIFAMCSALVADLLGNEENSHLAKCREAEHIRKLNQIYGAKVSRGLGIMVLNMRTSHLIAFRWALLMIMTAIRTGELQFDDENATALERAIDGLDIVAVDYGQDIGRQSCFDLNPNSSRGKEK